MDLSPPSDHGTYEARPKSSPAILWIAGLLTAVVVLVVIGAIVSSKAAHEDCMNSWRSYSTNAASRMDSTDPRSLRNTADAYRLSAEGMRSC